MQALHESELLYTQDHKLDLNGIAWVLLEDVVHTVMVEQVEELEAGYTTKRATVVAIATNTEAKRQIIGLECIDTEVLSVLERLSYLFERAKTKWSETCCLLCSRRSCEGYRWGNK